MAIGNKEIMAKNIKKFMSLKNVSATDVCLALKIKQNTFSDWVNAKSYPRIDKIELMARYFNIMKSELIEDKTSTLHLSPLEEEIIRKFRDSQHQEAILSLLNIKQN